MIGLLRRAGLFGKPAEQQPVLKSRWPEGHPLNRIAAEPIWAHRSGRVRPETDQWIPYTAEEVIQEYDKLIGEAYSIFENTECWPHFDQDFHDLIVNFARFVGVLPASQRYHHTGQMGLFRHSLDVAIRTTQEAARFLMTPSSNPADRQLHRLAWLASAFSAGLTHDIGKVHSIGSVWYHRQRPDPAMRDKMISKAYLPEVRPWNPNLEDLQSWVERERVETVYISFGDNDGNDPEGESSGPKKRNLHDDWRWPFFYRVVPPALRTLILETAPEVAEQHMRWLRFPSASCQDPLYRFVRDADHRSVQYDLHRDGVPGALPLNLVIARRFLDYAGSQKVWNAPGSPFINALMEVGRPGNTKLFTVSFFVATPEHCEDLVEYVRRDGFSDNVRISIPMNFPAYVFRSLETAGILNPTIDGVPLTPGQSQLATSEVPATDATVRFSPTSVSAGKAGHLVHEMADGGLLMDLPLIPLDQSPVRGHLQNRPRVRFDGVAPGESQEVLNARIERGVLMSDDEALRGDPAARYFIEQETDLRADSENPVERQAVMALAEMRQLRNERKGVKPVPVNGKAESRKRRTVATAVRNRAGAADPAERSVERPARTGSAEEERVAVEPRVVASHPWDESDPPPLGEEHSGQMEGGSDPYESPGESAGGESRFHDPVAAEPAEDLRPRWVRFFDERWAEGDVTPLFAANWAYHFDEKTGLAEIGEGGVLRVHMDALRPDGREQFTDAVVAADLDLLRVSAFWPGNTLPRKVRLLAVTIEGGTTGGWCTLKPTIAALLKETFRASRGTDS